MTYRKLDSNGDYSFGRSKQDFISDSNAVAQAIKTRLLLLFGEWWEDQSDGLPLFQSILGVSGTEDNLESVNLLIQERILNTDNVTDIVDFNSTYNNCALSITCTVNTTFGTTATVEVNY